MKPTTDVLIIDDDAAIRRTLQEVLAHRYVVHEAASGEEGLNACERIQPDVVLLDVMLPQMSGIGVLRALKKASRDLPVIMMTAYAEVQTAVQSIKLGAADYLQKPLDPDVVLTEVGRVVARRSDAQYAVRTDIVGQSPAIKRVLRANERFGPTDIPILLRGKTAPVRGWSRRRSTGSPSARTNRSSASTAQRFRRILPKASCSATKMAPSPAPASASAGACRSPIAALSSSTKSERWRWRRRRSC